MSCNHPVRYLRTIRAEDTIDDMLTTVCERCGWNMEYVEQ